MRRTFRFERLGAPSTGVRLRALIACGAAMLLLAAGVPLEAQGAQGGRGGGARAQELTAGRLALRTGDYDRAISIFERLASGQDASGDAMRYLLLTYLEVGKYDEAERAGERFSATPAGAVSVGASLGRVYHARGKLDEAERAFRKAYDESARDSLTALVNLAVLAFERGDGAAAMEQFDHFIDVFNRGGAVTSEDLTAVAIACRYLGRTDPEMFKDALKAFDRAIAADSLNLEPQVLVAELFLEKYNSPEAQAEFEKVSAVNPRHPRMLLGVAKRRLADGHPGVDSLLAASLEVNPNLAEARRQRTRLRLDVEDYDGALQEATRALEVDPSSTATLSIISAIHFMKGDSAAHIDAARKVLSRNPRYADLYVTLASLSARNRFYRQAANFAERAVELDPGYWPAHAELGMNLLRIGQVDRARASLETAFKGDPYHVLVKNTLDLLDTFTQYDVIDGERFQLMIGKQESALIELYATELLERTYEKFAQRYGYRPDGKVRVEFYRRHADFSVRTVGLAGIGALGVSFGNVLAMDSPVGRGEDARFNWGSVLLHELGHTFTLGVTNHRVPRWFSEGLSVFEERHSGLPGWGAEVTPSFLRAFKANLLAPVSALNNGFMRPRYPEQLIHSYFQASLVCEMVVEQGGERALLAMLNAYKAGQSNEQVFRTALDLSLEEVDRKFVEYVQTRFRTQLAAVGQAQLVTVDRSGGARIDQQADSGDFVKAMAAGHSAAEAGNADEAVKQFERAISLFPEYAEDDSPYVEVAQILAGRGDLKGAADMLARHNAINENAYAQHMAEALFRETVGDSAGAIRVLDRAMYIYPYDIKSHERLAELASAAGERKLAVRERRAVVALKPVDLAEAYYQLALALHEAGDNAAARREVLRSLEEAPNYEKAQQLLLKVRSGGSGNPMENR